MGKSVKRIILTQLNVYIGKNLQQSKFRITFWMKWDYYANSDIICTIYATFENIELFYVDLCEHTVAN